MRKFSALAVVSLLTLTGCAAPTVAESAPATVTVTASPEAQAPAVAEGAEVNPDEHIEKTFYNFAEKRAVAHGVPKDFSEKAVTSGLHAFCEDGKPFKVSKSSVLNKNLDSVAEKAYCDTLAN